MTKYRKSFGKGRKPASSKGLAALALLLAVAWPLAAFGIPDIAGTWRVIGPDYYCYDGNSTDNVTTDEFQILIVGKDPNFELIFLDFDNQTANTTVSGDNLTVSTPFDFVWDSDNFTVTEMTLAFQSNGQDGDIYWDYNRAGDNGTCDNGSAEGVLLKSSPPVGSADAYEPDDTAMAANVIVVEDTPQEHNFHKAKDADWVKFFGLQGTTYTIAAANLVAALPVVELFKDPEQGSLDNATGNNATISHEPEADSIFYVKVANEYPDVFGDGTDYALSVSDGGSGSSTLVGTVTDALSDAPVADARIQTTDNRTALSDAEGKYKMRHGGGTFGLAAKASGYETYTQDNVTTQTLDIALTPCNYELTPAQMSFLSDGGTDNITVTTDPNCSWTPASNVDWITFPESDDPIEGSGEFPVKVLQNDNETTRTGVVSVGDGRTVVAQAGNLDPCVVGTNETGSLINATISVEACSDENLFTVYLSQTPEDNVTGNLYVSVQAPTYPPLSPYVFFRPESQVDGSWVVLVKSGGAYLPDAEEYYFKSGDLGDGDLQFDIGMAGVQDELVGNTLIIESLYLEEGDDFNDANLKRIQRIIVTIVP